MKRALYLEFDDSFSFNVISELTKLPLEVVVVHWMDFESTDGFDLIVLGPGPGHPDDYQRIFPLIENWISDERPLLGICLGHQIYWRLLGEDVIRSKEPLHGQKVKLNLTPEWTSWLGVSGEVWVQRYNSLSVMGQVSTRYPHLKTFEVDGEIMITKGEKVITYQFHPESVGTTLPECFFRPVLRELV